jgi:hypothetical protein
MELRMRIIIRCGRAYSALMPTDVLLAHTGHWYEWVPYLIPVVIVLVASARALIHQRRERREGDPASGG